MEYWDQGFCKGHHRMVPKTGNNHRTVVNGAKKKEDKISKQE